MFAGFLIASLRTWFGFKCIAPPSPGADSAYCLGHGMVKDAFQMAASEAQIKWDRLYPVWSTRFLLRPGDATSGTWLRSRWKFGGGVGCVACRFAGVGSSFGRFEVASPSALQAINFQKHQDNPNHTTVAAAYLSGQASVLIGCPDWTYFETLANDMVRGRAFDNSSLKLKAAWCLLEAIRQQDQKAIKESTWISLFRDERHGRLLLRFRAVNDSLQIYSGTLGLQREFGSGATQITSATAKIMSRACTKMHDPPT